jgi:hypothetical protein
MRFPQAGGPRAAGTLPRHTTGDPSPGAARRQPRVFPEAHERSGSPFGPGMTLPVEQDHAASRLDRPGSGSSATMTRSRHWPATPGRLWLKGTNSWMLRLGSEARSVPRSTIVLGPPRAMLLNPPGRGPALREWAWLLGCPVGRSLWARPDDFEWNLGVIRVTLGGGRGLTIRRRPQAASREPAASRPLPAAGRRFGSGSSGSAGGKRPCGSGNSGA